VGWQLSLIIFIRKSLNLVFIQVPEITHIFLFITFIFWFNTLDCGFKTCAGRPGSLGYETKDANTYASWKVDYLKYDNCDSNGSIPEVLYPPMRDALNASGRSIFFSMCGMCFNW
jgi:hypothetical protein